MDHVKKLVYTIVGCLTIVSLTFTICTKIGHCASSDTNDDWLQSDDFYYIDSYPLPFGPNSDVAYSNYPVGSIFSDLISYVNANPHSNLPGADDYYLYIREIASDLSYIEFQVDWNPSSFSASSFGSNRYTFNYYSNYWNVYRYQNGAFSKYSDQYVSWGNKSLNLYEIITNNQLPKNTFIFRYPVAYVVDGVLQDNIIDVFKLSNNNSGGLGHTKGGVLGNYVDSIDMIEQDSQLPSVDTDPPSDPTSNSAWYQKILNGMGKINQSLKGGILTIGDYLGQIKEDLENLIAWITEPPDSDTILDNVEPYLAENDLISGFLSSKTTIQGVYSSIGSVSAKTRSQMVWDIPFNLPSMSQTFHAVIDFGWYENIRSTLEPFLNMFLCIGFLFSFIRSIPGILHGNSGEGDT